MNLRSNKRYSFARECAFSAVFVALVIALQVVFAAVPGVELVTVSFVAYSYTMGIRRGMITATAFSILRQFLFGVYPKVLVLYLVYYNLLAIGFGCLGKLNLRQSKNLVLCIVLSCVATVFFTMLDNFITPLWYGYTQQAAKLYFRASLPFLIPQVVNTAITVGLLLIPMQRAFELAKKSL